MVAEAAAQSEHNRQARKITCKSAYLREQYVPSILTSRIFDRTVICVIVGNIQLRQLYFWVYHEGIGHIPNKDQVMVSVRY